MRLLLDTHTFLWFLGGDLQLPQFARDLIEDIQNEVLLSVASLMVLVPLRLSGF